MGLLGPGYTREAMGNLWFLCNNPALDTFVSGVPSLPAPFILTFMDLLEDYIIFIAIVCVHNRQLKPLTCKTVLSIQSLTFSDLPDEPSSQTFTAQEMYHTNKYRSGRGCFV